MGSCGSPNPREEFEGTWVYNNGTDTVTVTIDTEEFSMTVVGSTNGTLVCDVKAYDTSAATMDPKITSGSGAYEAIPVDTPIYLKYRVEGDKELHVGMDFESYPAEATESP
jgi:hypothetical protein